MVERITDDILKQNEDKDIVVFTLVKDYLRQFDKEFHAMDRISFIVDEFEKNLGICDIDGKYKFEVKPVDSLKELDPDDYIIMITSEYYWKRKETIDELPFKVSGSVYYYEDRETGYYHHYLEKYSDTPIADSIVFRTGMRSPKDYPYSDFTDNAKALFDHMLASHYNDKYKLIWIVGDASIGLDYKDIKNVIFIEDEWKDTIDEEKRDIYYRAIITARYFFLTEHCGFIRFPRPGQIRVMLWHG
ncbi:MAG: hypothetical protein IJS24_07355, partial [Eubacterium sp.]|nr:hypothetical protein [Eubacterium sp.]